MLAVAPATAAVFCVVVSMQDEVEAGVTVHAVTATVPPHWHAPAKQTFASVPVQSVTCEH